ncbi:MAG: hypothetical protein IMZ53_02290 [Thermoplasmata archaeon]|nr:hypothetical protein [Thermoplasmata archaeon]MBE3139390.1 hypothetical protein [Thermoplasmata archaeon]
MFPNKKERYHLLSYTEEYKKVQGKGFEPQFTGMTTIDGGLFLLLIQNCKKITKTLLYYYIIRY